MPAGAAEDLVKMCADKGIKQVLFVRHASSAPLRNGAPSRKDAPHDWKHDDQMRILTPKGVDQCDAAAAWFNKLPLRALLSSPARRASETAMRMAARYETSESKADTLYLRMVEGVHPAGMSETCEVLFEDMGYGPLRKFFEVPQGMDAFMAYGDTVCAELANALGGCTDGNGTCVAVFGHAVFLNAIAFKVAQAAGASDEVKDILLDMDLGETQGIHIHLDGAIVEKLTS